jgi:hypothetical protein
MKDEPIAEFVKEKHGMKDCCYDNLDTPNCIKPLHYECPTCGYDITLAVFLYSEAVERKPMK